MFSIVLQVIIIYAVLLPNFVWIFVTYLFIFVFVIFEMPPKRKRSSASTPSAKKGKPAATEVPASAPTLITNTATTEVSEGELVQPIEGNTLNISPIPGPQPLRSVCDSLGLHLPANVKAKIHKGEFVQLGSLIQPPGTAPPSMSFALVQDGDKVILGQQPIRLPTIDTIEKWTSAFLIYMSVYLEVHTTRAIEMLKYIDTVRSAARQFGGYGWRTYDEQFRLKTGFKSYSVVGHN